MTHNKFVCFVEKEQEGQPKSGPLYDVFGQPVRFGSIARMYYLYGMKQKEKGIFKCLYNFKSSTFQTVRFTEKVMENSFPVQPTRK